MRNVEPPAKSKMAARGPPNGRRGLESGLPPGFWALPSTLLNKFFDLSTPSMRKGRDGEKWGGEKMMKIVATNVVASRPPNGGPTGTPTAHANTQ